MNEASRKTLPEIQGLPNITFRQLEVFCVVCHEGSYANAAVELKCPRANVKRVCEEFQIIVARPLFIEGPDHSLKPTSFALDLMERVRPLSRGLRRLGDTVRALHAKGRILRFAAAGEVFKGGLFTDFLTRLKISDIFQPCFLRIETKRLGNALLNAECDVYFGAGIACTGRLDRIDLGPVPWTIRAGAKCPAFPENPGVLPPGKWWIASAGQDETAEAVLEEFHAAGARDGRILSENSAPPPAADEFVFHHETGAPQSTAGAWPCYRFTAVMRKNHPYSELPARLADAALV